MAEEKSQMLYENDSYNGNVSAEHKNHNGPLHITIVTDEFGKSEVTSKSVTGKGNWEPVANFFRKSIIIGSLMLTCGVVVLIIDGVYMKDDIKYRKDDTTIVFGEALMCFLAAIFTFVAGRISRMALHITCMVFCMFCAVGSLTVMLLIACTDIPREMGDAWNHVGQYEKNEHGFLEFMKLPEDEFNYIKNHHAILFIGRAIFMGINTVLCLVQFAYCCRLTCCRPKIQVKIVYNVEDGVNQTNKLLS